MIDVGQVDPKKVSIYIGMSFLSGVLNILRTSMTPLGSSSIRISGMLMSAISGAVIFPCTVWLAFAIVTLTGIWASCLYWSLFIFSAVLTCAWVLQVMNSEPDGYRYWISSKSPMQFCIAFPK